MRGEQAYNFVDKCINLVFPRIKDWPGIEGKQWLPREIDKMLMQLGTTGDSSGNISWGFSREGAILFPEVEINYDVSDAKDV
jgi:large subunit ribosomal protein L5